MSKKDKSPLKQESNFGLLYCEIGTGILSKTHLFIKAIAFLAFHVIFHSGFHLKSEFLVALLLSTIKVILIAFF